MVEQSDIVKPKSFKIYDSHGNTDDEFEDYSEEEMSSEEESNENVCMPSNREGSFEKLSKVEGSSGEKPNEDSANDRESAEEVPCGDDSDDELSNEEDSDEEPEEASAEFPTEGTTLEEASDEDPTDESFEEISEEDYEDFDEEPNGEELMSGSVDQKSEYIFSESKVSVQSGCDDCLRVSNNLPTHSVVSKQPDDSLTSGKKRRSKWDIKPDDPMLVNESGDVNKKRKTRWSSDTKAEAPILGNVNGDLNKRRKTRWSSDGNELNMSSTLKLLSSVKDFLSDAYNDERIQRLNAKLQAINQKLLGSVIVNEHPREESSPSSQPNDDGFDSNMLRLRLLEQKHMIISELTNSKKKDKAKGPVHHAKFKKKLHIPSKEYPSYNFIGLMLGPNGNSMKKMEKETGAIIKIRGKGSSNKIKQRSSEDLYVLIESDSQTSFDAAVSMVEKLLVPVTDKHHKLYVGFLPQSVSSDKLKELFQPFGSICDVMVLKDNITGRSKEFGFVKYFNTSDAAKAIERMNGCMIYGKKIEVKIAETSSLTLNSNLPIYSGFASISPPSLNANLPILPGLTSIPSPSSNAKLPKDIGMRHPSSNANLPYHYGFASIPPSSNANLPYYFEHSAIPEEIPKPKFWPGPPGSLLPEPDIAFTKSSCNSLTYAQSMPAQCSTSFGLTFQTTSLGKNGYMMDGNAPKVASSRTPIPSLNANLSNYSGFAATIPGEIPESGSCFPKSCYNSLKYFESVPFRSSTYIGSTCQTSISSSQFPGVTEASNELASFPGYLKSFDPPDQLDQSMPSRSRSSRSPYFSGFSGNHLNPTWR